MKTLSKSDLESFKKAIFKDYGIELKEDELYQTAFNLLQFFEALIKFDRENHNLSSKRFENSTGQPIENPEGDKENE